MKLSDDRRLVRFCHRARKDLVLGDTTPAGGGLSKDDLYCVLVVTFGE